MERRFTAGADDGAKGAGISFSPLLTANAYRIAAFVSFLVAAPALGGSLRRAVRFIADDYNEGWNAFIADRALSGGLYPPSSEMIINNYPPLSFYIVGVLGHLIGSNIVAGRVLSIAAFAAIAVTIGVVVAVKGRSKTVGAFAAAYFASLFNTLPGGRLGMDDPQLLAHAVMTIGLAAIFLGPSRPGSLFTGALFMVAAGLVKESLIAVPLCVTLWKSFQGWRPLWEWLLTALVALMLAASLLLAVWGWTSINEMMSPRSFSLMKLLRDTQKAILWMDVPLAVWAIQLVMGRREPYFMLASAYVASSILILPLFFGGAGTNANIAFDLAIALALATGLGLAAAPHRKLSLALLLVLSASIIVSIPGSTIAVVIGGSRSEDEVELITRSDVDYLARHDGPVLCENLALCYWARKGFLYDAFNMGQAYRNGARDEQQLLSLLQTRRIGVIQLDNVTDNISDRFDDAFHQALDGNYVLDRHDLNRFFFVPRRAPSDKPGGP